MVYILVGVKTVELVHTTRWGLVKIEGKFYVRTTVPSVQSCRPDSHFPHVRVWPTPETTERGEDGN